MKKNILNRVLVASTAAIMVLGSGCNAFFDEVESLTKVSGGTLLSTEKGITTLVAEMYNSMPLEDFNYHPNDGGAGGGFYVRGIGASFYAANTDMYTDDAICSDGSAPIGQPGNNYWDYAYPRIRDVNIFMKDIVTAHDTGVLTDAAFTRLQGEAYFVRAYLYFGLVKRYGGVPLLAEALDNVYVPGTTNEAMFIPRSTEKEAWDFVLTDLDNAISNLEVSYGADAVRANKMAAYALKSRVALHAASIAKYWNEAPLTGDAVTKEYVGVASSEANRYYQMCIDASKAIIDSGQYSLYGANPASKEAAQNNFRNLFLEPNSEFIFWREYLYSNTVGYGHSYDAFFSPNQRTPRVLRWGRHNPTLDIVDAFEDYTDNGTGASAPIVTREDDNESFYYTSPNNMQLSVPFVKYDSPFEPFAGKDVRLLASILVPGADFRGSPMVIQGGMIHSDGSIAAYVRDEEKKGDVTYYSLGAAEAVNYSGFGDVAGPMENANFTNTGFTILKYLSASDMTIAGSTAQSVTPWIDFRLAEIYLNYAEAVVESGQGDSGLAARYINDLRHRAYHKDNITLTLENVLKERRVELAFEGRRYDDLLRRREYHKLWNGARRHALVPMVDLRDAEAKYIFVRVNQFHDERDGGRQFNPNNYYKAIPGTATNGLIQNPGQ